MHNNSVKAAWAKRLDSHMCMMPRRAGGGKRMEDIMSYSVHHWKTPMQNSEEGEKSKTESSLSAHYVVYC